MARDGNTVEVSVEFVLDEGFGVTDECLGDVVAKMEDPGVDVDLSADEATGVVDLNVLPTFCVVNVDGSLVFFVLLVLSETIVVLLVMGGVECVGFVFGGLVVCFDDCIVGLVVSAAVVEVVVVVSVIFVVLVVSVILVVLVVSVSLVVLVVSVSLVVLVVSVNLVVLVV